LATIEAYDRAIIERAEKYAKELLENYKKQALEAEIKEVITDIKYGSPKVKIAKEVAPKHEVDLIVCGATGLNAVERLLIGSVSEHITRYAKCDVLVVRTEKKLEE
jgi:nucleotide-binding universal stress UspA family protein